MKCPHCLVEFHDRKNEIEIDNDSDGIWRISKEKCPSCNRLILVLLCKKAIHKAGYVDFEERENYLIRPRATSRHPLSSDVPGDLANDYKEACLVFADSPKACAALGRRCLQHLLRKYAGVKPTDLSKEIDEILTRQTLPTHLSDSIDAIRHIGNFAAHPLKSTSSGEIIDVEPGEAEWTLDVLEGLFDFYFVQPAITKAKRAALDAKLKEAGKPPMK